MRILVDMDGVLADFDAGFLHQWRTLHPDRAFIPMEDRRTFHLRDQYPLEARPLIHAITRAPGFFRTLPAIPGGKAALEAMQQMGHEVFLCTAPFEDYRNCVLEKYEWVDQMLGAEWIGRIVMTKDKTLVTGTVLIDDRPQITGVTSPVWEHVLYDQPYNRAVTDKRRLTWVNWQDVLFGTINEHQRMTTNEHIRE